MHIQVIRLWPRRPPDGAVPLGLCCDAEGLSLGPASPLIRRAKGPDGRPCYRARSLFEVNAILSVGYGTEIDAWPIYGKLEQIAAWMTGGEWTMASLAALHLRLPVLADERALARLEEAEAILKVWNPQLHPRWPAHSDEGQGGEFRRPSEDVSITPIQESPVDIQVHFHHWHDQALTRQYRAQGLLTQEAFDNLTEGALARSPPIYQDVRNPDMRVHLFDAAHRAASAEVAKISREFIEENGITPEKPMTLAQSEELLLRIHTSNLPAIAAYRDRLVEYARNIGATARARFQYLRGLRSTPPR
jgi:hypothetical protein